MRLSPRPIFLGIVALGLPFAVTVGWSLGDPAVTTTTPPPAAAPAGAGGIGAAPSRDATSAPATVVDYATRTDRVASAAPSASAAVPVIVPPDAPTSAGSPGLPLALPTLTDPPVPTPTTVTSAPPSPSATPPGGASPEPTGIGRGLIRRS